MIYGMINKMSLPLRLFLPHGFTSRIGLKSIRDERNEIVLKFAKGRLLDIGCGPNILVKKYGNDSVGIDVFDFNGGAIIIEDASELPFKENTFDTVAFVASFNHIPNRKEVITEVDRILKSYGRVIITNLEPIIGKVRHRMFWIDKIEEGREKKEGEEEGLKSEYIMNLLIECGFELMKKMKFQFLNNIYVFERR